MPSPAAKLGAGLLLLLALWTRERVYLQLLPAVVYLALARWLWTSLGGGDSLAGTLVRRALPDAPDFIGSYCRKLTALWAGIFAISGTVVAGTALFGSYETWWAWTAWRLFAAMLAVMVVEFFVRKTWFRYYFRNGPFDRFWSRLFPAEATARGRRSHEAIRRHRARVGAARSSVTPQPLKARREAKPSRVG